eukprot:GAFH01000778.1.p1 GENE.GAFH01000778.1~~GAFH01000778.1.p1  ORF type:complete len:1009 (-),score=433.33 GAFH01000778.1:131-2905(-)
MRCLGCADAPCGHSCPAHIDVRAFVRAVSRHNYYEAAHVIYSDNPLGWTCSLLCSTSHQCRGGCNLNRLGKPIDIASIQQIACENFQKMRIPQVRPPVSTNPAFAQKITLIGAGPASLSCATYLARLGYTDVTILEKDATAGGIVSSEIPSFRIPNEVVQAEVRMVQELGVKIEYHKALGQEGRTLTSLKEAGSKAIFLGVGLPEPFSLPVFQNAPANVMTSKSFLRSVSFASKFSQGTLPQLHGHVLILGGGDVAFDSAKTAFRCGADRVTLAFREDIPQMPASWEEHYEGLRMKCDFLGNALPKSLVVADGKCTAVVMEMHNWQRQQGLYTEAETLTLNCSHVIVAFGAQLRDAAFLEPLTLARGRLPVNNQTMQSTQDPMIFAGGDLAGSHSIVEAVNDGKTAAWNMHCMLQRLGGGVAPLPDPSNPTMPRLHTVVDDVDVSVDLMGLHFPNPFGLSSAPPVTSVGMIKRAFAEGWGFAVTKTLCPDEMMVTNVSPRIVRDSTSNHHGPNQAGFMNIELLTEKSELYWVEGIRELKRDYPSHIVICSIMAPYEEKAWKRLAIRMAECGSDALELNLSCPHTGQKGTGMLAGQSPVAVREITRWVRDVVSIPVITKLTPNITDISELAQAAMEGGAHAVTAINTVQSLVTVNPDATGWPNVGGLTAYGGLSGNAIRPIAYKCISMISRRCPSLPILGCGGIDSAETAIGMVHTGASVIQITSAIQDHCYAIVSELVAGTKYYLYSQAREDLRTQWNGQTPAREASAQGPLFTAPLTIPKLATQVARVVPRISIVPKMPLQEQKCAHLNPDTCLHCGKCYMSCNDTGYQSIRFNPDTHLPEFHDETCMGCALCFSVCPSGSISMVPKPVPHLVSRGIPNHAVPYPFLAKEDVLREKMTGVKAPAPLMPRTGEEHTAASHAPAH